MKRILLSLLSVLLLAACAPTLKVEQHIGDLRIKDEDLPRRVAILPFRNETGEPGIEQVVRRNFANHFSATSYDDIKLPVVDEKVVQFEKASGKSLSGATPQEVSAALGSDGLIYGRVTDYTRIYAAVYSQFGIEAEVWMVNGRTGRELFRFREHVRYHEGGIPISPLTAAVTVVSTALNLREVQKMRVINELSGKFMEKIPAPRARGTEARPVIKEVLTNTADGPFGLKKALRVGMEGEPGLVATFDIGNFRRGVPMRESKPGLYVGEYPVTPGDNVREMPLLVTLSRPGGFETQWTESVHVTIDTTPPPGITGLRVKGLSDRVLLTWEGVKATPDLKGYRVMRSEQPLSGYREVAFVESPRYEDTAAVAGAPRYYRVAAVDTAGNEGDATDPLAGGLVSAEPLPLGGALMEDTLLNGACQVHETVTVPRGVTLTLGPDTRLLFAEGKGLVVQGRLIASGAETAVEFSPTARGRWSGIVLDGAHAELARVSIRGAETGITLRGAEGFIEGAVIEGNTTGMEISGIPGTIVKNSTITGNTTGVALTRSDARLTGNTVVQNGTGIRAEEFSGELSGNNIFDNERNIAAEKPFRVGPNYFGTLQVEEMRCGPVVPTAVYDAKVPGGKVVAAVTNPYAAMSQEERRRKGAELAKEGDDFFRRRNYGKAATSFEEALRAFPAAEHYYYLGICHMEMGEHDRAIALLREGVGKFPRDALLWKSLGMLYYERGDEGEARKALEEVVRLSPDDRQARFMLERLGGGGSK